MGRAVAERAVLNVTTDVIVDCSPNTGAGLHEASAVLIKPRADPNPFYGHPA